MPSTGRRSRDATRLAAPLIGGTLSLLGTGLFLQTVLESRELSQAFVSGPTWASILKRQGTHPAQIPGAPGPEVSLTAATAVALGLLAVTSLLTAIFRQAHETSFIDRLLVAVKRQALAWSPAGVWWLCWIISASSKSETALGMLSAGVDLAAAFCVALSALAMIPVSPRPGPAACEPGFGASRGARLTLLAAGCVYVVIFTAMNWGLWFNLRLPHGDSAMYEEHLWNLEHGKGFRSYLDQGLFLGEHLQVIHLLLIPVHLLFPSQLTLELAQSVILALGAWPLFRLARRHSGAEWAAALLGVAYLAYFPLQYLDISIDLKTFRPNSLAIPAVLAALDCLELGRFRRGALWLLLALSAQEDYAISIALIGAWLALTNRPLWPKGAPGRRRLAWGAALFVFGVSYLWLAVGVIIPWFRGGATVHTASYFSQFGVTPREIAHTLLMHPERMLVTLITPGALIYALLLLAPIGFLPLRSPGRLAVAAPLFLLLCMNDLAMQTPAPVHHFHAALIPILFWAAAAGLADGPAADVKLREGRPA